MTSKCSLFEICMLIVFALSDANGRKCLRREESSYKYFGTKTLYRDVKGNLPNSTPRGCTPIFIYLISRHGARYPGEDAVDTQKFVEKFAKSINETGSASLCQRDIEELKGWKVWTNKYNDKNLTKYGAGELQQLAVRYQNWLPGIMGLQNNPSKYRFSSTNKPRNIRSMRAFIGAIFNGSQEAQERTNIDQALPQEFDPLEFDDSCPRFIREVDNNPNVSKEFDKFIEGARITQIARRLRRRLGLQSTIPNKFVWILYNTCYEERFATARSAVWCTIFTKRDLKILEYASDLEDYRTDGYHFPINYQQNCFLVKEIVRHLTTAMRNDLSRNRSGLFGRFRFVSNKNILTLGTTLKLYQKQPAPTANGYRKQKNRSFRTSLLAPSAANIAFVLYRCNARLARKKFNFQIYWNEKLLTNYPGCPSATKKKQGLCSFDAWLQNNQEYKIGSSDECRQSDICE